MAVSRVNKTVKCTMDSESKLTFRKEKVSNCISAYIRVMTDPTISMVRGIQG